MNLQHHFLIAMPALQDPIFRRSVVYICEYNDEGAMGIIINKPLENLQVEGILVSVTHPPMPCFSEPRRCNESDYIMTMVDCCLQAPSHACIFHNVTYCFG